MTYASNGNMKQGEPTHIEKLTMALELLSENVEKLTNKIEIQTTKTEILSTKIESFMGFAANSIPSNVVYLIFILVFGVLFGIESLQFIFQHYLGTVLK